MNKPLGQANKELLSPLRGAIMSCVKNNDNRAKEYLYKQYYGYLMAIVLRYVKDSFDAEELVNEGFMRVFSKVESFKMHEEDESLEKLFLGWIGRIVTNLSIDHLRAKKKITLFEDSSSFEFYVPPVQPTADLEVADILKLLGQLPDIQRFIFNMYEVDGYTHEEIAVRLAIPESTSRTYLTRAKKKLREFYQQTNDN